MILFRDGSILNTVFHPHDSSGILNWLLWHWEQDLNASLLVLTTKGDGEALVNRIRAQLSIARRGIKEQHGQLKFEFGFSHLVFPWETLNGEAYEAVAFMPFRSRRHKLKEILAGFQMPDGLKTPEHR